MLLAGGGGRTQSLRFAIMMQAWVIAELHIAGGGIVRGHHDAGMGDRGIAHRWEGKIDLGQRHVWSTASDIAYPMAASAVA